MTFTELTQNIPLLLAYIICVVSLIQLFFIFFVNRKDIVQDLRGKDKIWQFLELSGIAWLTLFPVVVIASLLGITVEAGVWASMDAVYFMNLGGKMGHKWLDNQSAKPKKDEQV